jgi:hypothetical protein
MWSSIWKCFHKFTIRNWRPGIRAIGPFVLPPILVDAEAFGAIGHAAKSGTMIAIWPDRATMGHAMAMPATKPFQRFRDGARNID